jgi:hypothetical protein
VNWIPAFLLASGAMKMKKRPGRVTSAESRKYQRRFPMMSNT